MLRHKQYKKGFTLVEVALFLAITGLLFAGVIVGVQNSIYQQRFNDSIQNFAEFLRTIYSSVSNVENNLGKGNSEQAIYGKLITFGENRQSENSDGKDKIFVYTVIGDIKDTKSNNVLDKLKNLNAKIKDDETGEFAGIVDEYTPRWLAQIKNTNNKKYTGSLLIIRNPESGTIYTYYSSESDPEKALENINGNFTLSTSGDKKHNINFCISPEGVNDLNASRNVRIVAGARNASGIEIISDGTDENACKEK